MPPVSLAVSLDELRTRRSAKWRYYPEDVLPAWVAELDFPLAAPIKAALHAAVERDDAGYPYPTDVPAAFAAFAARRLGWAVDPTRVIVAPDVMVGIAELLGVLTAPGDGVVINPPVYPPFFARIRELGRTIVEAPLARDAAGVYALDLDALEAAFAGGARAYVLANPHNPTGDVLTRAELLAIADLAERHGVTVIADEIHAPLVLAGATHVPFVSLDHPAAARGISLTSASKAFNLAGLKNAVMVPGADADLVALNTMPGDVILWGSGHYGAIASIAAFADGDAWLDAVLVQLDANRRLLAELLAEHLPAVRYVAPEASYLAWLDCTALGLGDDPAATFLERGRVALSGGPAFGVQGNGFARLNIGTTPGLVEEAVVRMARAVD